MISFRCFGDELKNIESGKVKQITREIDWHNPVFEELEESQKLYHSNFSYSLGLLAIRDDENRFYNNFKIKNISYKDGFVIIKW